MTAGAGLAFTHRCAACNAVPATDRVGSSAEFTGDARQSFRKRVGGTHGNDSLVDDVPDFIAELHAFDILSEVVQTAQQAERIAQRRKRGLTETRRYAKPSLLSLFHHHAIL